MNNIKQIFTARFIVVAIGTLAVFFAPIYVHARVLLDFGFQIKEEVFCECTLNHRYKPGRAGFPSPLPPIPMNKGEAARGGSIATLPFGVPIPGLPQDTYERGGLNENEWILGSTHEIPVLMACVNLVFTFKGPRCKAEFGWLWRNLGSGEPTIKPPF